MIFCGGGLELDFNKTTFGVERLFASGDSERLSWVRGKTFGLPSGNNFLLKSHFGKDKFTAEFLYFSNMICSLAVTADADAVSFRYLFKNEGKKPLALEEGEIALSLPFQDSFDEPDISLRRRVHAHVRPHGAAYIYCERYSANLPAMGLVMTRGESFSYSLERNACKGARGNILLNLPAMTLPAGGTYECEFLLFPVMGREDFFRKAEEKGFPIVRAESLAVFSGEEVVLRSLSASAVKTESGEIPFTDGICRLRAEGSGEKRATILAGDRAVRLTYFVLSKDISARRAHFVAENQYLSEGEYQGAFTAYDREKSSILVRHGVRSPFSLAGFRAAPLLFLLGEDRRGTLPPEISDKADASIALYDREIYRGGEVSDDVRGKRARFFRRYYNYPLFAAIKYEEYLRSGDLALLRQSAEILIRLYQSGEVYETAPTVRITETLREKGEAALAGRLTDLIVAAADKLISSGNKYAPFKGLSYGPEIVYGALSTLLDAYLLSGNEYYLITAKEHLARLETFSFPSLDYATDEVPEIFQRDRAKGLIYDMSPHFTAAFFAVVYDKYYRATGEKVYRDLSYKILKASMTLFEESGASCRSKSAVKRVNDLEIPPYEEISCGEDVVLYEFGLLFERK